MPTAPAVLTPSPSIESTFANIQRVTKIKVYSGATEIGVISSITKNESRDVTPHFTLGGTDPENPKALIPGIVRSKTLRCDGFLIYKTNLMTAMGATKASDSFVTLRDQQLPFTIKITESDPSKSGKDADSITEQYDDCLISDFSSTRDIGRGDVRIAENVTISYRTCVSGA